MGIEEMFRDFKLGGYNLEITQVTGDRLIALILLISLAYCLSIFKVDKSKVRSQKSKVLPSRALSEVKRSID